MSKIIRVAKTQYLDFIRTKAFIVSVLFMPVLMGVSIGVQIILKDQADLSDRRFAIVDQTDYLFQHLEEASQQWNRYAVNDENKQIQPRFVVERVPVGTTPLELSERVRNGELFAFVRIDADVGDSSSEGVNYYTEATTYQVLPGWISNTINNAIRMQRFDQAGIDQALVNKLNQAVPLHKYGLVERSATGLVSTAEKVNEAAAFGVPMGAMVLMFMTVMMAAPALLNAVLEEKMHRIAEILVASVSPLELFLGKLLGIVAISWTLSTLYLAGITYLAFYFNFTEAIPLTLYAWFIVFQILALVIFGSIFMGIGAACNQLSDAQSMMMPAMVFAMLPMFVIGAVLHEPDSSFSIFVSLFPPCTPFLMLMRLAIPPGPEFWEIILGLILTLGFSFICIWAAGKVFRIGILSQGQAPTFRLLATWIFSK